MTYIVSFLVGFLSNFAYDIISKIFKKFANKKDRHSAK